MSAHHLPPVGPDATTPSQSQEMTVSALTTDSILVDLSVDSGQREDAELLSLTSIFHCPYRRKCQQPEWKGVLVMQVVW